MALTDKGRAVLARAKKLVATKHEARLNEFPQFVTEIDGTDIHFLHVRSDKPDALPLILTTLYLALRGDFARHRRLARFTFPLWLYVSVTGVVVFAFLNAYAS